MLTSLDHVGDKRLRMFKQGYRSVTVYYSASMLDANPNFSYYNMVAMVISILI